MKKSFKNNHSFGAAGIGGLSHLGGAMFVSAARVSAAQDVPVMAESGLPAAQLDIGFGIAGPAGMPRRIVAQLNRDIAAVLQDAETRERITRQGVTIAPGTPEQLGNTLKTMTCAFAS